ncbi:MAG: amidohydrolase [Lentisphaeria bacterium]|nr:amidohydrolase [Lentisphaeria bacterium]
MENTSLLLKNTVHNGKTCDVLIENGMFSKIADSVKAPADCRVINCNGNLAVSPAFYNTHTHAAMTLLRSYADDMNLFKWLQEYIWPVEAKLTPHDIYVGSKLAMLEMIRTGTVFFNDMYWYPMETIKAAKEMKLRAAVGMLFLSGADAEAEAGNNAVNQELEEKRSWIEEDGKIRLTLAPHAIYSVSREKLHSAACKSGSENYHLHIHLAETRSELENCQKEHGMTPAEYLDSIGVLGPKTILAHSLFLTPSDIELIRDRGAHISHNPCSNMKLGSGSFHYQEIVEKYGCEITIGTDGACSNNNISMLEEIKFAALSAKRQAHDPEVGKDTDIFKAATCNGAKAFGIDGGEIAVGKVADCLLVDLNNPLMVANYSFVSNMVYSADSSCIDTVICGGDILMLHKFIEGENEILQEARKCCRRIANI